MSTTTATDYRQAVNELHGFGSGHRLAVRRDGSTGDYLATDVHQLVDTADLGWFRCGHRTTDGKRRGEPITTVEEIEEYFVMS